MSSVNWFYDGKQFLSSHNNGSLIIWNSKNESKPVNILYPHSKYICRLNFKFSILFLTIIEFYGINLVSENDLIPQYNMVKKVNWEATKSG